jgi:hypothetical protein
LAVTTASCLKCSMRSKPWDKAITLHEEAEKARKLAA